MDAKKTMKLHEGPIPRPPRLASPLRQLLHLLVSAAGWAVFVYWWWIVLQQVSSQSVRVTGLFLLITLVVVVLVTVIWSWHNKRLHNRKGPRTQLREVKEDYSHDVVGRTVRFESTREAVQSQAEVEVVFDDTTKTYRPVRASLADAPHTRHSGEGA